MDPNVEDIQIIGAKGSIESKEEFLKKVRDYIANSPQGKKTLLQFLNADIVCGRQHLESALRHAIRSFQRGNAISDTLAMESLLYAAGEVQISRALAKMGISDGCENVACIIDPKLDIEGIMAFLDLIRDDGVLECTEVKLLRFGISKESISAAGSTTMADLVLEKVSMVDVRK